MASKLMPTNVFQAINAVQAAIAGEGISKGRKNTQQNYAFRGIDDVYNALTRHMADNGLVIVPSVVSRVVSERESKSGGTLFYVVVIVDYLLTLANEPESHTTSRMVGEAMDSGDKATNKAMSAAYKYLCLQTFCIPTEGDNDADSTTHEVKPVSVADMVLDGVDVDPKLLDDAEMAMRGALHKLSKDDIDLAEAQMLIGDAVHDLDGDHKVALWKRFNASERNALKKIGGM